MIASLSFLKISILVFDLTTQLPLPVSKVSEIPFLPIIVPPVGKSGPKIYFWRSIVLQSGLEIRRRVASIT